MTEEQALEVDRLIAKAPTDAAAVDSVAEYLGRDSETLGEYVLVLRTGRFDVVDDTPPVRRPTGAEIFHSKTREEQDAMLGPEAAEKLRAGEITLTDLAGESRLDSEADDFITQKPL